VSEPAEFFRGHASLSGCVESRIVTDAATLSEPAGQSR
jgi:hypothetical protein